MAQHLLDGDRDVVEVLPPPDGPPWSPPRATDAVGHQVLPDVSDTDGMYLVRFRLG